MLAPPTKRAMRKRGPALLSLLVVGLLFAGCGGAEIVAEKDAAKSDQLGNAAEEASGVSVNAGEQILPTCQNFPPPSFCAGGVDSIFASGTDPNGCTIWACKPPYLVIDDNPSPADSHILADLHAFLTSLPGNKLVFPQRKASEIAKPDLDGRVTTFVYDNKALIINNGLDYGIVIHDHPFAGSPDKCAITTYLAEIMPNNIFVIQRDSSQVSYDDLRAEMYKDCKQAGEKWFVQPSTRYNVCCKGLEFISVASVVAPGVCSYSGDWVGCSACGNAVCESWENACNCPKDCPN
jgi:hypothetical protein